LAISRDNTLQQDEQDLAAIVQRLQTAWLKHAACGVQRPLGCFRILTNGKQNGGMPWMSSLQLPKNILLDAAPLELGIVWQHGGDKLFAIV
jgi:hypothetical protein